MLFLFFRSTFEYYSSPSVRVSGSPEKIQHFKKNENQTCDLNEV